MQQEQFKKWEATRLKGKARYFMFSGILYFGMPMFILMAFIQKPFAHGLVSPTAIAHYITWPLAGLFFAVITWYFAEFQYKKERAKRNK